MLLLPFHPLYVRRRLLGKVILLFVSLFVLSYLSCLPVFFCLVCSLTHQQVQVLALLSQNAHPALVLLPFSCRYAVSHSVVEPESLFKC